MAVLGHRDPRMTMRYQHLTPEHFKDAMRALDSAPNGTITALEEKSGKRAVPNSAS
jgi:hypothetical protein